MKNKTVEDILKTLKQYKTDREVDEHNEDGQFRIGYVKAMNDAINLINKNSISTVLPSVIKEMIDYIEESEVNIDGEWGSNRKIDAIINDGDMPELYAKLLLLFNGR